LYEDANYQISSQIVSNQSINCLGQIGNLVLMNTYIFILVRFFGMEL